MEKRIEVAAVQIEAHKLALLQQPDPAIAGKPLLRVPLGEGNEIGWSAADWKNSWDFGSTEFETDYAVNHGGKQPSKEVVKQCGDYIYCNKLDPGSPTNWETAYSRLVAGGVIAQAGIIAQQEKPQAPKKLTPQEFAKEVGEAMERIDTRTAAGRKQMAEIRQKYLLLEAGPIYDSFIADLESRGVYLTQAEQQQLIEWVQNNNLVLTQRQSFEKALRALFPKYLTTEDAALIALDRDDGPGTYVTAAEIKKAVGTAAPRVGYAVQNR